MVEVGEKDLGARLAEALSSRSAGNPWAAMPSLHFATSLLAAILLAETGPLAGRRGLGVRADARASRSCTWASTTRSTWSRAPRWWRSCGAASRSGEPLALRISAAAAAAGAGRQRLTRLPVLEGMGSDPEVVDRDVERRGGGPGDRALVLRRSEATRADARRGPAPRGGDLHPAAEARRHPGRGREARRRQRRSGSRSRSPSTCLAFFSYVALFRGVVGERGPPPRVARVVPDHHGRAGGDAAVLGGRRRRHRAHLLGASQGRDAAAPDGVPDGGLPGSALRRLHAGAGALRRAAAHRRAERRQPGRPDDRPGGDRRRR